MPRNASGTYSLPAGNPVVSGTLIDSGWANTTMNDLGNEMTDSLSRSGEGGMLAPFRITDGLQATPSLAFSNEPSTGFYRAGTNEMWSVVGGTQITQFTATGMTGRFAAGAVSTPSFTAYNDLNTGIYFPAADEIAITTAGVQRLSINSTGTVSVPGNVAITGTFSVTGALTANNFSSSGATLTGGSINNMAIGAMTASTGAFTTATATTGNITTVNATTVDTTNIEVTNIKAKDGTAAASIADSTGVISVTSNPILSAGTSNGVLFLNGSKVATSGSALQFSGTNLSLGAAVTSLTWGQFVGVQANYPGLVLSSTASGGKKWSIGADAAVLTFRNETDSTTAAVIDGSNNFGIGTSSPAYKLDVSQSQNGQTAVQLTNSNAGASAEATFIANNGTYVGSFGVAGASKSAFGAILASDAYVFSNANVANTGITLMANSANGVIKFATGGSAEKMRLDSSGNLGLGVTPNSGFTDFTVFQNQQAAILGYPGQTHYTQNAYYQSPNWKYIASSIAATRYEQSSGAHAWHTAASGTAGNTITFTQAMTLDASSNWVVGGTTVDPFLRGDERLATVNTTSSSQNLALSLNGGSSAGRGAQIYMGVGGTRHFTIVANSNESTFGTSSNTPLRFTTNETERARITSDGNFLVGSTSYDSALKGILLSGSGILYATADGAGPATFNRLTNDGDLIGFQQASTLEGTISVSGATVSYNAFAGSHWSQLQDGSKPDILRGTVMESINELCVWPGEQNERLPKSKISDTAGSKKVYGVFMAWDNDWTTTNDMYVTAVGAFICRVNGSVTVQEGDLLESNGDGTARVQADDIIRSSTIGKVTSTVKTHEYDDGSYCVPTVLYCG